MVKLNILNMENFLETVNKCRGAVYLLYPDGHRENISHRQEIQEKLQMRFRENKNFLRISLDIPGSADYMRIITYYAGNL